MVLKSKFLGFFLLILSSTSGCNSQELPVELDVELAQMKLDRGFILFDATAYTSKPNLAVYGFKPMQNIQAFWDAGESQENLPSEARVKALSRKVLKDKEVAFVDIEHWPLQGTEKQVKVSLLKYKTVLDWVKEASPQVKLGLYSMFPIRDYWRAVKSESHHEYKQWQRENDQLKALAESDSVDIIYPSIYTYYRDQEGWVKYAIANIKEARRLNPNKPVYVFLWPQYHGSSKLFRHTYIAGDYWKLQLETVYKYADGVIIWGGWDFDKWKAEAWNDSAPWWKSTQEFVKDIASKE